MREEKWPGIPRMVVSGYITTGALGRGTLTKARGACPVRRTRDIMPGDRKPGPSETENKRILAVSKHKQENCEMLGLKFLCI